MSGSFPSRQPPWPLAQASGDPRGAARCAGGVKWVVGWWVEVGIGSPRLEKARGTSTSTAPSRFPALTFPRSWAFTAQELRRKKAEAVGKRGPGWGARPRSWRRGEGRKRLQQKGEPAPSAQPAARRSLEVRTESSKNQKPHQNKQNSFFSLTRFLSADEMQRGVRATRLRQTHPPRLSRELLPWWPTV